MGRHEAYVWDSVSMEWRRRLSSEEGVRSKVRAEVPYAEFVERMGLERKPGLSWAERKRLRELQDRFPRTQAEIRRDRLMQSFSRGTASGARGPTGRCPYQVRCSLPGASLRRGTTSCARCAVHLQSLTLRRGR